MNIKKTAIAAAVATTLGVGFTGGAQAAAIGTITLQGTQYFGMGQFTGSTFIPWSGIGSDSDISVFSTFTGNNTAQPTGTGGVCASGSVGCFDFGSAQVNTFAAAGSAQLGDGMTRPTLGGQTYNETGGTENVDFSGFYANFNTTDFNQGNASVAFNTTNCVAGTCDFTMSWTSLIVGGPFDGNTGSWFLQGSVQPSAIPVPAAAWLMGSGLLGLVGVARRRKVKK